MQRRLRIKLDTILGIIIRSGGDISQSEISQQCKEFFSYNTEMSHRVRMSKMLIQLEREGLIVRKVFNGGNEPSNFWYIRKERLKDVVQKVPSTIQEAEWSEPSTLYD